ncbi:MAG: fumarylacetoacetate hydrolase family protein [SAR202 cluster bacterium]|jgi:2-keto-4-pentenoate hydratase/2-oxohepta-3-ene-1,7-dioic acid hydratase in catechol pathway|nr:fumarylacetoacetate hydrolase family protein [SAR202 cluster bacterium]MDP6301850.1 fumarylacetoacetate hydrolase family protein [SAR202 cluster bacterium]MDP7104175.1 fumarylacetoacetate hydrolase family protein [SAR202 cluster bacterium]MDP7225830.1 fumarylacetoacetate hydrolase family protein [SAR202 cluster bacterium]MDP7413687.1 fumarylacetoacetate hydrolase family protein [SAR202 cluster bacterium]|tara:strand:+ start:4138 stop:5049 length:912 start_codon:yes stop_codon:yes gene_type:complete
MKLAFFNDFTLGVVKGDSIVDVSGAVSDVPHLSPQDLINGVIANFAQYKGAIQAAADQGSGVALDSVRLRSPMPKPHNIVAMAVNYMEDGTRDEPAPINAFLKSPNAVIGNGDTVILPDVPASIFEFEAEMALVISKHASNVKAADAFDYIFGYMNFLDGSARGVTPFYQMKSRETFAPMGPYLVTPDEFANPQNLQIQSWTNGNLRQNFNTDDMAHQLPRVIEWVTSVHSLDAGDVIATGTNHRGLIAIMGGDVLEIEIETLGRLKLDVQDDFKRTWPYETRLERMDKGLEGTAAQATGKYA